VYFTWNSESDVINIRNFITVNRYRFEEVVEETKDRIWYLFKIYF